MPLSAVIFDMDGTLVDSERVIMHAWLAASRETGRPMRQEDYASVIGLNDEESNAILVSLLGGVDTFRAVRHSVRDRLAAMPDSVVYPLKPGALELLKALREEGIPCAVASSSSAQEIEDRLTRVGVLDFFRTVAGGDEVERGKPDPAVYQLAAARLGISPGRCLAFEDSAHGAASASAAGATVVLVPDMREATPELVQSVSLVLGSLTEAVPRVPAWFGLRGSLAERPQVVPVAPSSLVTSVNPNTGTQLRSLYATQGGVSEIFSAKVAEYVASRPDYPASLFEMLHTTCHLHQGAVVADIGAGTGLLTQGLLRRGYNVIAAEPNAAMRTAADHLLAGFQGYRSIDCAAESTSLAPSSVDLITVAQAFHWFDIDCARSEFLRILRPGGRVALIWNDRVLTDPLHLALDEVFAEYGGAKRSALVAHEEERKDVPRFFGTTPPEKFSYPHRHLLNESALLSLVFSRSYMPDKDSASGREASHQVRRIFQRHATEGVVDVRYTTVAFVGRPQ